MRHLAKCLLMLSFAAASVSAVPAQAQSGNLDWGVTISSGMPPPRVVYSAPPPPPAVQRVWVDGYWGWSRGFSVWVPGHWEVAQLRYGQPGWGRNDQAFRHERHERDHHQDHEGRRGEDHDGRRAEDHGRRH